MKLGIVQGRLLEPVDELLQSFPSKNWLLEINKLESLGLTGLEWLITSKVYESNPILRSDFKYFKSVTSVCLDNLIHNNIHNKSFFIGVMNRVCSQTKIRNINIPILEDSSMVNKQDRINFIKNLNFVSQNYKNVNFCIEAELDIDSYLEIVESNQNYFVTYDTGNLTSFGADHSKYISQFGTKIKFVHIKDRSFDGITKPLHKGDTDFDQIFYELNKVNFSGVFILQLAREKTGHEEQTVKNQIHEIKKLYNKYFN